MAISGGQWLAELAATLNRERRATVRYKYQAEDGPLQARDEQGREVPAQILDISTQGIGLLLAFRPEKGALLWLEMPLRQSDKTFGLWVRVNQADPHQAERWRVGCTWLRKLTDADLLALL